MRTDYFQRHSLGSCIIRRATWPNGRGRSYVAGSLRYRDDTDLLSLGDDYRI